MISWSADIMIGGRTMISVFRINCKASGGSREQLLDSERSRQTLRKHHVEVRKAERIAHKRGLGAEIEYISENGKLRKTKIWKS
jgi:hypothetical protein